MLRVTLWVGAAAVLLACSSNDSTSTGTGGKDGGTTGGSGGTHTGGSGGTHTGGSGGTVATGGAGGTVATGGSGGTGGQACTWGSSSGCPAGQYCDAPGCGAGTCVAIPAET